MPRRKQAMPGRPPIHVALAFFVDPDFQDHFTHVFIALGRWLKESSAEAEKALHAETVAFIERWGVLPPDDYEVFHLAQRRAAIIAVKSGRWGVIPVFPWTTKRDIQRAAGSIRRAIGKEHQDAVESRRRDARVAWLVENGYRPEEIAKAVFNRRRGLRRLTKAQADPRAQRLLTARMRTGMPYAQAVREAERAARNEPAAAVQIRVLVERYRKRKAGEQSALNGPIECERIAYLLTKIVAWARPFRKSSPDAIEVFKTAEELRIALTRP